MAHQLCNENCGELYAYIFVSVCVFFFGLSHLPPGVKQQTKVRFTDVVLAEVALKHFSTHAPQAIRTIIRT